MAAAALQRGDRLSRTVTLEFVSPTAFKSLEMQMPVPLPGLVFVHVIYGIPITTLIFRNYFAGVPDDLLEAARVDGATETQVFFRIIIPSIQGTLLTVSTTIIIFSLKLFSSLHCFHKHVGYCHNCHIRSLSSYDTLTKRY